MCKLWSWIKWQMTQCSLSDWRANLSYFLFSSKRSLAFESFCWNEMITTLIIYSSPMINYLIDRLSSHFTEQTTVFFKRVITSVIFFLSQVYICVWLCEHKSHCLVVLYTGGLLYILYLLIVCCWLKTSIIHGPPDLQGDSGNISHLPSEELTKRVNAYSSLKSVCFKNVKQI